MLHIATQLSLIATPRQLIHRIASSHMHNVLQAKEFGEAEVWMNERLMRAAPGCFAEFLTAFEAEETTSKNKGPEPLWLIWQYEGDYTLWDLMQKKDFPYNLEQALLGRELDMPKGPQRKAVTISVVMQQVSCACLPL